MREIKFCFFFSKLGFVYVYMPIVSGYIPILKNEYALILSTALLLLAVGFLFGLIGHVSFLYFICVEFTTENKRVSQLFFLLFGLINAFLVCFLFLCHWSCNNSQIYLVF